MWGIFVDTLFSRLMIEGEQIIKMIESLFLGENVRVIACFLEIKYKRVKHFSRNCMNRPERMISQTYLFWVVEI